MENVLKKVKLRQVDWMPRVKPNDFKDLGLTPEHRSLHEIHHLLVFIYPLTKPNSNITIYNVYIYQTVDFIIVSFNTVWLDCTEYTHTSTFVIWQLNLVVADPSRQLHVGNWVVFLLTSVYGYTKEEIIKDTMFMY